MNIFFKFRSWAWQQVQIWIQEFFCNDSLPLRDRDLSEKAYRWGIAQPGRRCALSEFITNFFSLAAPNQSVNNHWTGQ